MTLAARAREQAPRVAQQRADRQAARNKLEQDANEWMDQHPEIVAAFRDLAVPCIAENRRFGWKAVAEVLRWNLKVHVPNDFITYIGRRLEQNIPALRRLTEKRKISGDQQAETIARIARRSA